MNQTSMRLLILAVILSAAGMTATKLWKTIRMRQLTDCIKNKDTQRFRALANARSTRFLFLPYNLEYLKLNAYLLEGDTVMIDQQFDQMLQLHLSNQRERDLVMKAFNYYLGEENKKKAKALLARIKGWEDETLTKEAQKLYDILIAHSACYIAQMEEQLEKADAQNRVYLEFLLYKQYQHAGNTKKADTYRSLYQTHAKHTGGSPYQKQEPC